MQLLLKLPGNRVQSLTVEAGRDFAWLKAHLERSLGVPAKEQSLLADGRLLSDDSTLQMIESHDALPIVEMHRRFRGGASTMTVKIKPRIQKDKWSLYWKESMETKTEPLEEVQLELKSNATVGEMHLALQHKFGWLATDKCERLEGFKDPWDIAIFKGRQVQPSTALESLGLGSDDHIITVRRILIPEVWKVIEEGQDEDDISSEDEDW